MPRSSQVTQFTVKVAEYQKLRRSSVCPKHVALGWERGAERAHTAGRCLAYLPTALDCDNGGCCALQAEHQMFLHLC